MTKDEELTKPRDKKERVPKTRMTSTDTFLDTSFPERDHELSSVQEAESEAKADRRLHKHIKGLERHHFAVDLAEAFTSNYQARLWEEAEKRARERGDGVITRVDVQEAADDMKKGEPENPWRSWMSPVGGALLSAGVGVFLSGLSGAVNLMSVASMGLVVVGLVLVLVFRPQH